MLAKTPRKPDFETLLRIPPKPREIVEADLAWRKAVSEREAGQARHVEAHRQLQAQRAGMPVSVTRHEVDELGLALTPLFEAETAAAEARAALRQRYEAEATASLTAALDRYHDAIADALNGLEELLTHGSVLHAAAVAQGVRIPHRLPSMCGALITEIVAGGRIALRPIDVDRSTKRIQSGDPFL